MGKYSGLFECAHPKVKDEPAALKNLPTAFIPERALLKDGRPTFKVLHPPFKVEHTKVKDEHTNLNAQHTAFSYACAAFKAEHACAIALHTKPN